MQDKVRACKQPATEAGKGESLTDRAAASDPESGSGDSGWGFCQNLLMIVLERIK